MNAAEVPVVNAVPADLKNVPRKNHGMVFPSVKISDDASNNTLESFNARVCPILSDKYPLGTSITRALILAIIVNMPRVLAVAFGRARR